MRALTLAGLFVVGCSHPPAPIVDAGPTEAELRHAHADEAFHTFLVDYWNGYYLIANDPPSLRVTGYWVFAQAWDVVSDHVERTGRAQAWHDTFFEAAAAHGWNRDYFDDENWMVLVLMRAFDQTHEQRFLDQAVTLFSDIQTNASDTTCCGTMPGGLWWDRAKTSKATAINGAAVISAVRLSERTGDSTYLDFAKATYAFWYARMADPVTHQIGDNFNTTGKQIWWKFTYNEGVMIGGALELYRVTHDERYLTDAHGFAGFMVARETVATDAGPVLHDGDASCDGDCPQFKGIGYRYLLALQKVSPKDEYLQVLKASADAVWGIAKAPNSAHFGTEWEAAAPTEFLIEADSSASMALSGFAGFESPAPAVGTTDVYEAEEAALSGLKVSALGRGYSGWGYLTEWSIDGQAAVFPIQVATAGNYQLVFRYAAGGHDASRQVSLTGGTVIAADQLFPDTLSATTYSEVVVPVTLSAGPASVTVIFASQAGSHGSMNLDRLTVRAAP